MESIYSTQSAGSAGTATVGGTNPRQTGYGVGIGTIDLDMSSQSLDSTGRGMDCAIQATAFSWWEIRPTISTAWTPSRD